MNTKSKPSIWNTSSPLTISQTTAWQDNESERRDLTRIRFSSELKQPSTMPATYTLTCIGDSNGLAIQYSVSESQMYEVIIDDADMETKVFSSSNKTMDSTELLWCSITKMFIGHWESLPSLTVRVFGNLVWNFSPMREHSGVNGRAER